MKKFSIGLLALAAALAITPSAKADSFSFNFSGSGQSGGGLLTGTLISGNEFAITNASYFTIDGFAATLVANPQGPLGAYDNGFALYDNILFSGASIGFDYNGILFELSNGDYVNIWSNGGVLYFDEYINGNWVDNGTNGVVISENIAATPEPSSLLLLGTGLLGLAFLAFRKSKPSGNLVLCA